MYKQALNVAASDAVDLDLHLSGLVELPPSALSALQGAMTSGQPLVVQLGATAIARPQQKIAAGVRGFAAAEGTIQLPVWLARSLQVDQPGAKVYVEAMPHTALPSAESCCLRATDPRFLALSNARAVLETALSTRFRTLTLGTSIPVRHLDATYQLKVDSLEPAFSCSLVDTDLEVDLQGPVVASATEQQSREIVHIPTGHPEGVTIRTSVAQPAKAQFERPSDMAFDVTCQSTGGDFELYIGDESCPSPSRLQHTATMSGDCVNSGTLRVAAGTSRGTEWHVVVLPYKCDSCSITVSVVPVDAADGSAGLASPPASAKEAANMKVCENCGERVPAARYTLHTAYCARHNVRCATCGRVVRKNDMPQHWHCDRCWQETVVCSSEAAKLKHLDIFHTPLTCDCGVQLELRPMQEHRSKECPLRTIICRFCFNHLPAGEPAADAGDRAKGLTQHESVCGSRTEACATCGRRVRLKEMDIHQQLHNAGAFGAGGNSGVGSSGSSQKGSSTTYVARPLSPNSRLRVRQTAWARAGLDPGEFDAMFNDGADAAVGQPVPRATQIPASTAVAAATPAVSSHRPNTHTPAVEGPPRPLCANQYCYRERQFASEGLLCEFCQRKVGPATHDGKELVGQLVKRYFTQLTTGCGLAGCSNEYCASNTAVQTRSPPDAAREALSLARQALQETPAAYICLDSSAEYAVRPQLNSLVEMGFAPGWCARALSLTGNEMEPAAIYLVNHANESMVAQ